ncbi:MAG TPA: META domain-containing protein [Candidatus Limnocylindria bacterium]|nr:META domain-containing protein [Candidatus Limnocylindria bacterium]
MSARVAVAALGLLFLVACGSLAANQGLADLRGHTFLSTGVTENGQAKQLVAGTRIRLGFSDDGRRIAVHAGCNHLGGEARVQDGRLVAEDMAMTAMACDGGRSEQDAWLARFLTGRPTIRLSGTELVLANSTTEIRLLDRTVADPDRPLTGTRWIVESIVDRDTASSIPQGAVAHLILSGDGTFTGNTGCNQMGGAAGTTGPAIRFSDVFTTRIACEQDRMRLEQAVLSVLRDEVSYEIEADLLRLRHPSGRGIDLRAEL